MSSPEIERLIQLLAKLPGLGPRSARRATLYLIKRRDSHLNSLAEAMINAGASVHPCHVCGNLDSGDPCGICADDRRQSSSICVVEDIADLWALERTASYRGVYHVLGGTLSALDNRGPEELKINTLVGRVAEGGVSEVILATSATVEGQTTAHYIIDRLEELRLSIDADFNVSRLAQGVPIGGELEYLDDGTLSAALKARRPV
tara:strand:- start:92 stop:703 length:612 start_codon:yes stop_codon:yes gene_type:complete